MWQRIASAIYCCASLALVIWGSTAVLAQEASIVTSPAVTAAATTEQVRFISFDKITYIRLEVFSATGDQLFDSAFKSGDLLDWDLRDQQGQRLADGSYLCVVTVKDLSGQLSQKHGLVSLLGQQVALQRVAPEQLLAGAARAWADSRAPQGLGPVQRSGDLVMIGEDTGANSTIATHDGREGQVSRTRGALTFRVGDFFSGQDREQMRLTETGDLGLGTKRPQAKLDVVGDIRARGFLRAGRGIEFPDGTVQTSGLSGRKDAQGNIIPSLAGTGTMGRLAKWTDNNGTLGDSVITESNSNIGIGTNTPASLLHIGQFGGYGATTGLLLGNNLNGTQYDRALQVAPVQVASPSVNSVLLYAIPTINQGVTVPNQFGLFVDLKQGPGTATSYAALTTGQIPNLGATNNTHLLMGQLAIPAGNYAVYDGTGYKSFFSGNVGIGTTTPGSRLTVAGVIQSTSGGIKFPDGTVQTTAVPAHNTFAVCATGASDGNFCFNGNCDCQNAVLITRVNGACNVTSETGSCSANTYCSSCCVCRP